MRFTTHTLLIAATVASSLATGQPVVAQSSVPLTADEKREKTRLSQAWNVSITRLAAEKRFAFADKCEAAFAAGDPMPEVDIFIKDEVEIDNDLMDMTVEEISEQFGLASDEKRASEKAWKGCVLKYRKKDSGS